MKRVEFPPPKGYMPPEGTSSGDEFEQLTKYRLNANGHLCMVALGEHRMHGYDDKPADNSGPPTDLASNFKAKMQERMNGPEGGAY